MTATEALRAAVARLAAAGIVDAPRDARRLLAHAMGIAPDRVTLHLSDAIDANVTLRIKMAESSNVYAVAVLADGRVLYTVKDVKVTLGGCGG